MKVKTAQRTLTVIDQEIQRIHNRATDTDTTLGIRSDAAKAFREQYKQNISILGKLLDAKYEIRQAIAQFNIDKGINEKTAEIAKLTELNAFISLENTHRVREVSRWSANTTPRYYVGKDNALEDETLADQRKIQRYVAQLKDSCSGINSQGSITIKESTREFLDSLGLI